MPGIVVKPRARILHGHDWVFSSEVLKVFGKPADGDVISLKDGRDHLIGGENRVSIWTSLIAVSHKPPNTGRAEVSI